MHTSRNEIARGCRKQLPILLHWRPSRGKVLYRGEIQGVYGLHGVYWWGGAPTSIDSLFWFLKVSLRGVRFHLERQTRHWGSFSYCCAGYSAILPPSPFPWGYFQDTGSESHLPDSQSGEGCCSQHHSIYLGVMDGVLYHYKTAGHSSPRQDIVPDRKSRPDPEGGTRWDSVPQHVNRPCSGIPLIEMGQRDGGMVNCADIHGKRDGSWGSGMLQYPHPTL